MCYPTFKLGNVKCRNPVYVYKYSNKIRVYIVRSVPVELGRTADSFCVSDLF